MLFNCKNILEIDNNNYTTTNYNYAYVFNHMWNILVCYVLIGVLNV